jgi:cytochrome c-type biogenesis protein CcmF
MLSEFGYLTLALAFLLTVYGLIAVIWGLTQRSHAWMESARLTLLLIFPLVTTSLVVMIFLLLDNRFDVAYVYSVGSLDLPQYLKLSALWGGQSGSLLLWSWLLACASLVFSIRKWRKDQDLLPWVLLVFFITLGFFLALNVFGEIPFTRFWHFPDGERVLAIFQPPGAWSLAPQDGQGLNPLLRHPGMIWHPPALYLGFVGFIIPFALGVATLATGRKDQRWIEISRPWVLLTWVFLSLGLVLGMRWAYDILGWGGYWGWDPVEIAALMPWLSATAFLHTAILQRRRGAFKRMNLVLILLTYVLVIFGTFLTRSGVLSSVHSFAESEIGTPMFVYLALITLASLGLLFYRWPGLYSSYEPQFEFSREVLTLFSSLVFLSILAVCFLGVIYPIISELLTGTQITVGPAWYKRITGPLFLLLVFLMGVCPLAAWGSTNFVRMKKRLPVLGLLSLLFPLLAWSLADVRNGLALIAFWLSGLAGWVILAEFFRGVSRVLQRKPHHDLGTFWAPFRRNRRRYGGLLVHLGIVLMSIGIIGIEGLQQETQATLLLGESIKVRDYEFKFAGVEAVTTGDGLNITETVLAVTRDGIPVGALYPQRQVYLTMGMAITQPGIRSTLAEDLYAILIDWHPVSEDQATFRIFINPLVNWLWIGTGVLTIGTVVAGWPERKKR